MNCKRPKFKHMNDGHVMCENEGCPYIIKSLFVNDRTKEQWNFTGCTALLTLFYTREMWLRTMGVQKVGEQTRNLILANLDPKIIEASLERMKKIGAKPVEEGGLSDDIRPKKLRLETSDI